MKRALGLSVDGGTRSRITTLAPREATSAAVASPIPDAPPVTMATLSVQSAVIFVMLPPPNGASMHLLSCACVAELVSVCELCSAVQSAFPERRRTTRAVWDRDHRRILLLFEKALHIFVIFRGPTPHRVQALRAKQSCRLHTSSCHRGLHHQGDDDSVRRRRKLGSAEWRLSAAWWQAESPVLHRNEC